MQTITRSNFTTVKTEGAILPADLLQRVADGGVEGVRPQDYHLAPTERLNEAISRSWNRLQGVWESFDRQRQNLATSDSGVSLTRERWLLILFQELGYGRLPFQRKIDLEDGAEYPISHLWGNVPIHLLTFRQELDRRDPAIKRSPHSLLQEFLNRSDDHLWGIVSNGLALRILRDNASMTRAAFLEFDLQAMMAGELYADFTLLWLVCHQSRVELGADPDAPDTPANCWLERWSQEAKEQGTRALDALRDGVQEAISALGRGFLAHGGNGELKDKLNTGSLSTGDYYRQLLRLVYRLIFLFVSEDRDLLLLPGIGGEIRARVNNYYSVGRLRTLSEARRGGPHPDLYRSLRQLFSLLREGYEPLGLPALGSFLFSARSTPDLDISDIANNDLLNAIRALAFTIEGRVLRPVDYKNLGAEELGSVYESLLELHPQLNLDAATFELKVAAGSERKTTGSYYTPSSLINELLNSALEPVVADRLRGKSGKEAEEALLNLKVVDPAAGSGHFLIGAANRLATHLARVRTGDDEPGPADRRDALRDVVGRCIYGVDINEMAVELCKVALWMETLDPGRPLSFLDANIQCGNSLIGATPALLAKGIPDNAFKPITGDDKAYCTHWRKRNKAQRSGQLDLLVAGTEPWQRLGNLAEALSQLQTLEDGTLSGVQQQEEAYAQLVRSSDYEYGKLWADAWCAAFVWVKKPEDQGGFPYPITEQVFRRLERSPYNEPKWLKDDIKRHAGEYQFFHWHLAFPQVFTPREDFPRNSEFPGKWRDDDVTGWTGGFDVVLGNPPWERIKLQEKEWFASRDMEIATARNAAARRKLIAALPKNNLGLYADFMKDKRQAEATSHFVRSSGRHPLCGRGDVNTYAIFAELSRQVLDETGRTGIIVPSGIATDYTTRFYFQDLLVSQSLASLFEFENEGFFTAGQGHMVRFALITIGGSECKTESVDFVFQAKVIEDLKVDDKHFTLTAKDILLINPNTLTCPIFRSKRDAEITKSVYRRVPVAIEEGKTDINPWHMSFQRMFDMANDSNLFHTREQLESSGWKLCGNVFCKDDERYLPLYEAKMMYQFSHRHGDFNDGSGDKRPHILPEISLELLQDPRFWNLPFYWVSEMEVSARLKNRWPSKWLIGWRDVTDSRASARTVIFCIIPLSGVGHTLPLMFFFDRTAQEVSGLVSNLSSFILDFLARQKVGGLHLTYNYLKQLPILIPETYEIDAIWDTNYLLGSWISHRCLELTYTAYNLKPFAQDCGYIGPPFRWYEDRRFLLRCELDAAFFHLYDIERDDVDYIMETFPIVKRRDEAAHGEYRTKRVILEIYDEMATAMRTGQPYQTHLDPPPAHPDAAHPWDEDYLGPYKPPEEWWQEKEWRVESGEVRVRTESGRGETAGQQLTDQPTPSAPAVSPAASKAIKEPSPTFELKPPPPPAKERKTEPHSLPDQPSLISDFNPPQGNRNQRLKRVMALGQPKNSSELGELAAALGDEDSNIRWLAGSSLVRLRGHGVVQTLAAFLEQGPGQPGEGEAIKVLSLIAETDEDETVREAAGRVIG